MTSILLRPAELPTSPTSPRVLTGSWAWWKIRVDGDIRTETSPREVAITFDGNSPAKLINPPVVRVITNTRLGGLRSMVLSQRREIFIVWYGSPGGRWERLPGTTCCPGQYLFEDTTDDELDRLQREITSMTDYKDAYEMRFQPDWPALRWPLDTAPFVSAREREARRIADTFGVPTADVRPIRERTALPDKPPETLRDAMRTVLGSGGGGGAGGVLAFDGSSGTWAPQVGNGGFLVFDDEVAAGQVFRSEQLETWGGDIIGQLQNTITGVVGGLVTGIAETLGELTITGPTWLPTDEPVEPSPPEQVGEVRHLDFDAKPVQHKPITVDRKLDLD